MGSINQRLRSMRKYLGKSQADFGAVGGVSQSTQNRYEQPGTDVPMSYLEKIFEKFGDKFNENWFYFGKGEMRQSLEPSPGSTERTGKKTKPEFKGLSQEESQIVAEVGQFSKFLKDRPLRPQVKRRLLQLLVESIDQALEELPDNDPDND